MRLNSLLFIAALILPRLCAAGGTLGTEELGRLIAQMPVVRDLLGSSVRLSDSAFAEVRLGPHFKNLGGARMGPYTIQATSKKDGSALVVVLCTKARFLNSAGQELPEARIEEAASIDEKLTGVMLLQEDSASAGRPPC
jgi:hypothetical protein